MAKFFGILAAVVFACSAAFHLATFVPTISVSMGQAWPLHLCTMAVFAIMVISLVAAQKRQPRQHAKGIFAQWRATNQQSREFHTKVLGLVPFPLRILFFAALFYVAVNFGLFIMLMEGGGPAAENGKYYLKNHGQMIRELTKEEYQRFLVYEVRGFSGHWMFFAMAPTIYFFFVHPRLRELLSNDAKGNCAVGRNQNESV